MMGSSPADIDAGADANEGSQRRIAIGRELAVGRFEVTRDQFQAFVEASGYKPGDRCWTLEFNEPLERNSRSFRNPGYAQTGTHPAVCVSWRDARAYVDWLSNVTGKPYRLLSEAEWEYVARAGISARYPSGSTALDLCAFGNGADQVARAAGIPSTWGYLACTDAHVYTAPVGSFSANGFGLFDVTGNVWEWTQDCHAASLENAPGDGTATSTGDCSKRTVRGGSWSAGAQKLRFPVRAGASADARYDDIGFRVARALSLQP
jgi:formylglycine-generating enzyme required for sulfatase activity